MRSLIVLAFLAACAPKPAEEPAAPEEAEAPAEEAAAPEQAASGAESDEATLAKVDAALDQLAGTLQTNLKGKLQAEGAAGALSFCHEQAGPLTETASRETGVSMGRASVKLRNPGNAGPAWVQSWLATHGGGSAGDAAAVREVVEVDGRRMAHVLRPIVVQPPCLQCHGSEDQLAEGVAEQLAAKYPDDQATGYAVGDLRGVFWAETAVVPGQ